MKTASVALAALIIGGVVPGTAQAQTMPVATLLDRLDTEGNGSVSRDEVAAARERLFERLDLNRDGTLDLQEIEDLRDAIMDRAVAMQARLGSRWRRMDANGDGAVSAEEFRGRAILFGLADRDGDGQLSAAEFTSIRPILERSSQ